MSPVLTYQLDYIYFVYGLVCFLLAIATYLLYRTRRDSFPWRWLVAYGVVSGVNRWIDIFFLANNDDFLLAATRLLGLAIAYSILIEFGRRGTNTMRGDGPGWMVYFPLLCLMALPMSRDLASMEVHMRYFLGLTGALWAGWSLWLYAHKSRPSSQILMCSSALFVIYGLSLALTSPHAPFFPASVINRAALAALTGFSPRVPQIVIVFMIAATMWRQYLSACPAPRQKRAFQLEYLILGSIIAFLLIGAKATEFAGDQALRNERSRLLKLAGESAARIATADEELEPGHHEEKFPFTTRNLHAESRILAGAGVSSASLYIPREQGRVIRIDGISENPILSSPEDKCFDWTQLQSWDTVIAGPCGEKGEFLAIYGSVWCPERNRVLGVIRLMVPVADVLSDILRQRLVVILITALIVHILLLFLWIRHMTDLSAAQLKDREAMFSAITESARDAIMMIDENGRIDFWNASAERIFGWSENEVLGKNLHSLIAPARYHKDHFHAFPHFQKTGKGRAVGQTLELAAARRDGREFPIELSLSAARSGGAWHAIGIIRDITARKDVEIELRKAKAETEQANVELKAAIERASRLAVQANVANYAKSQFLANMSHEIRTPMNGIIGMTGLLLDTNVDREQREYLEIVRQSGESLLQIINDILDFSKIEAGKLDFFPMPFKLREFLENTMKVFMLKAKEKAIDYSLSVSDEVPDSIVADETRVRQVLVNLIGNAIKFTPTGGRVRVSVCPDGPSINGDDLSSLRFSVEDTGIGISQDKLSSIFEPFVQADGTLTREHGGTGLGLPIAEKLVSMMKGKIRCESREGEGSAFHVTIPVSAPEERPQEKAPGTETDRETGRPLRILLVEDNAVNQILVERMLDKSGHELTMASDAEEALQLLGPYPQKALFDLILMDCQMPGMDGFELSSLIRQREMDSGSHIPIIAVTAYAMDGDRARCLRAGMDDYVPKPIQAQKLLDAIARWSDKRDLRQPNGDADGLTAV